MFLVETPCKPACYRLNKVIIVSRSSGKVTLARVLWAVLPGDVKPHKAPHLQSAGFMLTVSPKNTGMLVTIPEPVEDMQQQPVLLKFQGCLLAVLEDPGWWFDPWTNLKNGYMLCKVQQSRFGLNCDAILLYFTYQIINVNAKIVVYHYIIMFQVCILHSF